MDNEKQQTEHLGSSDCSSDATLVSAMRILANDIEGGNYGDADKLILDAANMLEFFFDEMQMHSPKMDGQHSYRFRSGWPWTHCVGRNPEEAVRAAIREVTEQTGKIG